MVEQVFFSFYERFIEIKTKTKQKQPTKPTRRKKNSKQTRKCQTTIGKADVPGVNVTLLFLKADNRIVSARHGHG